MEEKNLDSLIIQSLKETYAGYKQPFKSSDEILATKDSGYKEMYFEKAAALCSNDVLLQEIEEWKRTLIEQLAMEAIDETARAAYRLTLISIKENFEKRLISLARRVKSLPVKRLVDSL